MNKLQKICLALSILFCINYALSLLLGFHMITNIIANGGWVEKLFAFLFGVCGFVNILLFKKED